MMKFSITLLAVKYLTLHVYDRDISFTTLAFLNHFICIKHEYNKCFYITVVYRDLNQDLDTIVAYALENDFVNVLCLIADS